MCALALVISLAGCGQNGKAVVTDISTTQYFTEETVSQEDMETLVQAGINAPSAMNGQPWHFSVITDAEVLKQISGGMGGGMGFGGRPQGALDGEMTFPEGMTPPEAMEGGRPEGMEPPEGFAPDGTMPEGMEFPAMPEGMDFSEGQPPAAPGGGSMNKAGITDAPLVIVISCKAGF